MERDYSSFQCKVCGNLVLVPLPAKSEDGENTGSNHRELTCSNGHTDSYDLSDLQILNAKPMKAIKMKRAVAGIG